MPGIVDFISEKDEEAIIDAIRETEKNTSGEIRVHIENNCDMDVYEHALEIFHELKMDNTKLQNGVLIYVAVDNKSFVIYGDKGINDVVGAKFWNSTKNKIATQFKKGHFKQGLIDGISEAGKVLSLHFPSIDSNIDELDNTISKG